MKLKAYKLAGGDIRTLSTDQACELTTLFTALISRWCDIQGIPFSKDASLDVMKVAIVASGLLARARASEDEITKNAAEGVAMVHAAELLQEGGAA